jgi:hypothetical protein
MRGLREPLGYTRRQRTTLAVLGLVLVAVGGFFLIIGGIVLVPIGLAGLTVAVLPQRWPMWSGIVLGVLVTPLLLGLAATAYVGYRCARPEPWLEVRFRDSAAAQDGLLGVDGEADFRSQTARDGTEVYRVVFARGGTDTRDRWVRDLRGSSGFVRVRAGSDRTCGY